MTPEVDDLLETVLHGEDASARVHALSQLVTRGHASRGLLLSLTEHLDDAVVLAATHALGDSAEPNELVELFELTDGLARDQIAERLLEQTPAVGIQRVLAVYGPVPREGRIARALGAAIVQSEDPRGQHALKELAIAGFVDPAHLDAASRTELLERARDAEGDERLKLLDLVVYGGSRDVGLTALPGAIEDALRADASGTIPWRYVWSALLLPRQDLPGPGRDAVAHALYYATDHRPRFSPPPARWEDDERRLAVRFALERVELQADVLGYLRRVELDIPLDEPASGDDNPMWPLCAVLDHLGRPLYPHPHAASFVRARPQREVSAAIDHIGPAFADPDRFDGDLEAQYAQLRVRSRKRILGWARRRS